MKVVATVDNTTLMGDKKGAKEINELESRLNPSRTV